MTVRRLLDVGAMVALVALVLVVVIYAFPAIVGAEQSYVVLSGSMEPSISTGDAIIVQHVSTSRIAAGDVITFRVEGETTPTTHRVVEVVDDGDSSAFRTKGDANENVDPRVVPADAVVGRVLVVIPYLGFLLTYIDRPLGYLLFIGLPFSLLFLNELWTLRGTGDAVDSTAGESPPADTEDHEEREKPTSDSSVVESSKGISLTRADLRLTVPLLIGVTGYTAWIAVQSPGDFLRVAIASGAGLLTLFLGSAYVLLGSFDDGAATHGTTTSIDLVQQGMQPERGDVPIASLQTMVQLAARADSPIVADTELRHYQLTADETVYYHEPDDQADADPPVVNAQPEVASVAHNADAASALAEDEST